jgi:hypothetical protein
VSKFVVTIDAYGVSTMARCVASGGSVDLSNSGAQYRGEPFRPQQLAALVGELRESPRLEQRLQFRIGGIAAENLARLLDDSRHQLAPPGIPG